MFFQNSKKMRAHKLGKSGEAIAMEFLERKDYMILEKSFRFMRGEIDLIARDGPTIVFVEVKTRADSPFGSPEESITPAKCRQIRRVAQGFILKKHIKESACRFDVLSIIFGADGRYRIKHIKNAF